MFAARFARVALAALLLLTGVRTRPVEIAPDRFERLKPPLTVTVAGRT